MKKFTTSTDHNSILSESFAWRLFEWDAFQVLKQLKTNSIDMIITDPPFDNHVHATHGHRSIRNGFRNSGAFQFDPLTSYDWVHEALRVARRWCIFFCSDEQKYLYRQASPECYQRGGIWIKPNAMPQFTGDRPGQGHEGIVFMHEGITFMHPRAGTDFDIGELEKQEWNSKGKHGVYSCNKPHDRYHDCEKPVPLLRELIRDFAKPGETILDLFCGSASLGQAVIEERENIPGLRYIGGDMNPEDVRMGSLRCEDAMAGIPWTNKRIKELRKLNGSRQASLFGATK